MKKNYKNYEKYKNINYDLFLSIYILLFYRLNKFRLNKFIINKFYIN
jgi:hypothetical protein